MIEKDSSIWNIFHQGEYTRNNLKPPQGGPLPVINGVITPISRVVIPVTIIYKAIYRGITPLTTGRPPCTYRFSTCSAGVDRCAT